MPKTITIPFDVTVNSVKYAAGSTPSVNSTVADGIVAMVTWTNDSLAFVTKKGRGTFVDGSAV